MVHIDRRNRKEFNRNPFNEKLLHRFFMEALYFDSEVRKRSDLVPKGISDKVRRSNLALVVPEDATESGYRADFSLYFKDYDKPIPVEIKWNPIDILLRKNRHQLNHLKKHSGYVVGFHADEGDFDEIESNGVFIALIDPMDFSGWLSKRIYSLSRDALATKGIYTGNGGAWLVALRGAGAIENFRKMKNYSKSWFWAFKNCMYNVMNLFSLQKGDEISFVFFTSPEDGNAMKKSRSNRKLNVFGWAIVRVTKPYYMCLQGEQASFFEVSIDELGKKVPVNRRKWVHFVDFNEVESRLGDDFRFEFKNRALDSKIAESANQQGGLTGLSTSEADTLKSILKSRS